MVTLNHSPTGGYVKNDEGLRSVGQENIGALSTKNAVQSGNRLPGTSGTGFLDDF
jgi:hypothetical protein